MPGFRRRFVILPREGEVTAALEDDIHCMAVTLVHDGEQVLSVSAEMDRGPWNSCPGAIAVIMDSFSGVSLSKATHKATDRGDKRQNCTHLYDLAELAAAHALDTAPTHYDVHVSDPESGLVTAELYRNGERELQWQLENDNVIAPEPLAGSHLVKLRDRFGGLAGLEREAARILQWACLVAHGRTMPWDLQSDATRMPASCYSFQPGRAGSARRIDTRLDFSAGGRKPLSHFDGRTFKR